MEASTHGQDKLIWAQGWQKGILKRVMDSLPTDKLEKVVSEWPLNTPKKTRYAEVLQHFPLIDLCEGGGVLVELK